VPAIEGTHGYLLKLERAEQELNALSTDIKRYVERDLHPVPSGGQLDLRAEWNVIKWSGVLDPDPMWGVRLGEIVHNLRSSLDHLVTNFVIQGTGNARPDKDTGFPILAEEGNWVATCEQRNRKTDRPSPIAGVTPAAFALIKAAQPFNPGKKGQNDPLFKLHRLNLVDKHRSLHLAKVTAERSENLTIEPSYVTALQVRWPRHPYVIENDAELARVKIALTAVPEPDVQISVSPIIHTDVWFGALNQDPIATVRMVGEAFNDVRAIIEAGIELLV
jgi:hypothetical protein